MPLLPGHTVGIDFGTCFSAIARLSDGGIPAAVPNEAGQLKTRSVVLLGDNGHVTVDPPLERVFQQRDSEKVVRNIKRQLGDKEVYYIYENKKLTPEFVAALVLKKLRQDAEEQIGAIANVVLAAPCCFDAHRREAIQHAARIAGLNMVELISEPRAFTLAHAWSLGEMGDRNRFAGEKTILVVSLGGGVCETTIVQYSATQIRIIATEGDPNLGGLDWTSRLVEKLAERFLQHFNIDPRSDDESLLTLTEFCDDAKQQLSRNEHIATTCSLNNNELPFTLSRSEFLEATVDLTERLKALVESVLTSTDIGPTGLDEVLLVGEATQMPGLKSLIEQLFDGRRVQVASHEQLVAQGVAIHAAICEAADNDKNNHGTGRRFVDSVSERLRAINRFDVW